MNIRLTPDQEGFIRQGIESGRFHSADEAIRQALSFWEERERMRAEILAVADQALNSLAREEGRTVTPQSMRELAKEVKRRGRSTLSKEKNADSR